MEPKALANRPVLDHWMMPYLKAFYVLSGRRSYGFTANPIQFEAIYCYIILHQIDDFEDFIDIISLMDKAYLLKNADIQKRKEDSKKVKKAK